MKRLAILALAAGCSGGGNDGPPKTVFGGTRPVTLQVPTTYSPDTAAPLLVVLHGYGVNASIQSYYFGSDALVETEGVLIAAPEGTVDQDQNQFWNATDACCDFYGTGVDDVGYLRGLISDIRGDYNVDPNRIYLWGHSNGGFMSFRMACEAPEISAIVSLAGATYKDAAMCDPAGTASVLQIHGTLDDSVPYDGSAFLPGAVETVTDWAGYDGCTGVLGTSGRMDLDSVLAGDETQVSRFAGCGADREVELWTIENGSHIPDFHPTIAQTVWGWLEAHPGP